MLASIVSSALGGLRSVHAAELFTEGPAECPDGAELTFRVERAIGMSISEAAPLRFGVRFEGARAGSYLAVLAVEQRDPAARSERVLRAGACAELADAVTVAIALALGSNGRSRTIAAEPAAAAPIGAEVDTTSGPPGRASPVSEAKGVGGVKNIEDIEDIEGVRGIEGVRDIEDVGGIENAAEGQDAEVPLASAAGRLTPALAVLLVGDTGSLPGAGWGLGLGAELRAARFGVRAAGMVLFDRHVALSNVEAPALGADMNLALGSLSACTKPVGAGRYDLGVSVCAGWELGRLQAVGTGVREPRRAGTFWSAPRVDLELSIPLGASPLRWLTQLTAATPLKRDDFYLRDLGSVHRPPVVTGRLAIGLDVSFE